MKHASMSAVSQIVDGGGWKGTRVEMIKVKAWAALVSAIVLGGVAVTEPDSFWVYASIPAGLGFLLFLILLIWEKPRAITIPRGSVGGDPRKLYGMKW